MSKTKKTTLHIQGMHCNSCNILIEDSFKKVKNIRDVKANFNKQEAEILYSGHLDKSVLDRQINEYGYRIVEPNTIKKEPYLNKLIEVTTIAGILFILYFFAQQFGIVPKFNTSIGSNLTFLSVFVLGLVASTSTCMATSGALFLATIGKHKTGQSMISNLLPAVSFNVGRILSYGFFGFLVGAVGSAIVQNVIFSSVMTIFISTAMILIGLNMTGLLSFIPLTGNGLTKNIFQSLEAKLIKHPKKTSFLLGAITYLLPCGFTQSVQLYALGLANPTLSLLLMMTFAIGTTPMLIALAFTNSFKNYSFYPYFQKIIGIIIFAIGINYIFNGLALHGIKINFSKSVNTVANLAEKKNGYQIVKMAVDAGGYSPNSFVVKQNIPVKWVVDGKNVFGCQGFLVAPQMNIQSALKLGENVFEFTPSQKGTLNFSCSMGMYRGSFTVI